MTLQATTKIADGHEFGGTTVTFEFHERHRRRFYTWREYETKTRMYVHCGDETVLDNLVNRTSRPHTVWGKVIRQAMKDLGWDETSIRWSQKAGCSCPCSPGFIVTNAPTVTEINGQTMLRYDIWVKVDGVPVVRSDETRAARAAALGINDPWTEPNWDDLDEETKDEIMREVTA